jgi:hypothetical protein
MKTPKLVSEIKMSYYLSYWLNYLNITTYTQMREYYYKIKPKPHHHLMASETKQEYESIVEYYEKL